MRSSSQAKSSESDGRTSEADFASRPHCASSLLSDMPRVIEKNHVGSRAGPMKADANFQAPLP